MEKSVLIQRSWIDDFCEKLQRKGNDASSIERTRWELEHLRDDYQIDLTTITKIDLNEHLTKYQKNHKPNGYRLHVVRIRQALKFLKRKSSALTLKYLRRDRKCLPTKSPCL